MSDTGIRYTIPYELVVVVVPLRCLAVDFSTDSNVDVINIVDLDTLDGRKISLTIFPSIFVSQIYIPKTYISLRNNSIIIV